MSKVKSKRDDELFKMMSAFKTLNEREQGYVLGLAEGFNLCKPNIENRKGDEQEWKRTSETA